MTTWNPSDKNAAITLSSSDLTASESGASDNKCVRGTTSKSSGKWYFEGSVTGKGTQFGVMHSGSSLTAGVGGASTDLAIGFNAALNVTKHKGGAATNVTTYTYAPPHKVGVAIDLDAAKIWFRFDGTWIEGDPVAGTGQSYATPFVTGTYYPAWSSSTAFQAASCDVKLGDGTPTYGPPTGFEMWDHGAAVTVEGTGSSVGTSTAQAYFGAFGAAAGTSTATAVGQAVRESTGSAAGRSIATGYLTNPASINVMPLTGDVRQIDPAYTYNYTNDYSSFPALTTLKDGNRGGTPYTSASGKGVLAVTNSGTTAIDRLVIYSGAPDPSDQMAYPTFGASDNGLVGSASGSTIAPLLIRIRGTGDSVWGNLTAGNTTPFTFTDSLGVVRSITKRNISGSEIQYYITGNNLTRLELPIPPANTGYGVGAIQIIGESAGNMAGLKTGTLIYEIEISHNYTFYEGIYQSFANVTANTELHHVVYASSTANATSTIAGFETQTEVSTAHATAVFGSQTDSSLELVSTANATSKVEDEGHRSLTLVSTANATSVVPGSASTVSTSVSTANVTSSVQIAVTRGISLISKANATSSVEAIQQQTAVSAANATSSAVGSRSGTEELVSTANATSSTAGTSTFETWGGTAESVSHAHATSSVLGSQLDSAVTLVSTADARAYVILPPLPGGLSALWCNPLTHAAASWSGTPFESVIEVDGVVYGAGAEGIYKMETEIDEETEVDAYVTWDLLDFGDPKKHRPGDFIIDGTAGAPLRVTVANEQGRYEYLTHLLENTKTTNFRARLGKGLNSRHIRFTVGNTKSREFWFDAAEIEVIQLSRHIGGRHA